MAKKKQNKTTTDVSTITQQTTLTPVQVKELEKISSSLAVSDPNSIISYGNELQSIMSKNADNLVSQAKATQIDEIGTLVTDLLGELNMIDIDDLYGETSSIKRFLISLPIIGKLFRNIKNQVIKYESVKTNIKDIEDKIHATRMIAMRDNNSLQVMFNNDIDYINHIEQLITAGKMKLQQIKDEYNNMDVENMELYERNAYDEFIIRLDKKLDDLFRVQYVLKQNLVQIQAVQTNNCFIMERANDIITTTIPLWKTQLGLAIALADQKKSAEAHKMITDTTNELLRREAEMLKTNSINIAQENERSVVDIETLRETQQKLIETVQEVRKIHDDATQKRITAEQELLQLANEFRDGLQEVLTSNNYQHDKLTA